MKAFFDSFTFLLAFLFLVILINLALGSAVTEKFLLLVLLGMVLLNGQKFASVFNPLSKGV